MGRQGAGTAQVHKAIVWPWFVHVALLACAQTRSSSWIMQQWLRWRGMRAQVG
jgi:hypothetical protein